MKYSGVKNWFLAIRPKTLWAAFSPVFVGSAMAYGDGYCNITLFLMTLLGATLIQIGTNFANDYYDYIKGADTEERMGPTRATQAGLISPQKMKWAFIITFTFAFFSGLYLAWHGGNVILIIGIISIISGILYTGGPYPLGYNGLGDIFVWVFFGPIAVGATYYLQAMQIRHEHIASGVAIGALATAILVVNNLRDMPTDRKVGKKTLAVRFGKTFTYFEYVFCLGVAFTLPIYLYLWNLKNEKIFIILLPIPLALILCKKVFILEGKNLNPILGKTALLLLLYSLFFSIAWIIS